MSQSSRGADTHCRDSGEIRSIECPSLSTNPPGLGENFNQPSHRSTWKAGKGALIGGERMEKLKEISLVHNLAEVSTRRKKSFSGIEHGSQAMIVSGVSWLHPVSVCCGYHGNIPPIGRPKQTKIYFLSVLEARRPKSRCQQVWFSLRFSP